MTYLRISELHLHSCWCRLFYMYELQNQENPTVSKLAYKISSLIIPQKWMLFFLALGSYDHA